MSYSLLFEEGFLNNGCVLNTICMDLLSNSFAVVEAGLNPC